MVNQKLVKYFDIYTQKGYKHYHLKNHLVTVGFHPEEIDEAIRFLQERKTAAYQNASVKTKMSQPELKPAKPIEIKILASLYFIFAFMLLFYSLMLFVSPDALPDSDFLRNIIGEPISFFASFLLIAAGISVFIGWGIWNVQPWARIEGIALSALAAFTVVGIPITFMTLYFFSKKEIKELFAQKARTQNTQTSNSSRLP